MASTDAVFAAIADPTRRAVLEYLSQGGRNAGEIAARFAISWPAVSRHLRLLKNAGLVWEVKAGRHRFYEVNTNQLVMVGQWLSQFKPVPQSAPPASGLFATGREYTS
jgi:DNA-binding transcriptional ArsR family regulator